MRKRWTDSEVESLKRLYPDHRTEDLVGILGHSKASIFGKAKILGLRKSVSFVESEKSGRIMKGSGQGGSSRFKPGHVPANKGLRRPGYKPGRMGETQFKKGHRPHTWVPLGSEKLLVGYLMRKVSDTGYPPRDWRPVHRIIWEEANGPIPQGSVLCFKNGDKTHIDLANLELVTRCELARRNRMWTNYPRELCETIQLAGVLKRKIRRRNREEQDGRPEKPPVRGS